MRVTHFKCRDGAALPGRALEPSVIYSWRGLMLPPTIKAYAASGILETLDGAPSAGIDVVEIDPRWLQDAPAPPVAEALITEAELLKRLNISAGDLSILTGQYGFPRNEATKTSGGSMWNQQTQRLWRWSTIERWRQSNPLTNRRSGDSAVADAVWGE